MKVDHTEMSYQSEVRTLTVHLPSEVDHHTSKNLREQSEQFLDTFDIQRIVFDFSDTDFMDSSGIGLIMGRYKLMQTWGGSVTIANLPPKLEKIVSLSGLRDLCSVVKEVKEVEGEE